MTDGIDDGALAALVDSARREDPPAGQPARRSRVRKVDFARPTKFSSEHERRITRLLQTFCRSASTRLGAELRMTIELDLVAVNQLTWANAHQQVPAGALSATILASPVGTRMLLASERRLALAAVERLLGGPSGDVPDRRLTDIDWAIARLFFTRLLTQLSVVFNDVAGVDLAVEALESHLDTEQLATVSEPTLAAVIEARHDGMTSTLMLLLPYAAFVPFADAFSRRAGDRPDEEDGERLESVVADVEVLVHAEVGALDLPIEQVLEIRPGAVLTFTRPAAAGVSLSVGGVPVCTGSPGRQGRRRAVQVGGGVVP